MMDPAVAVPLHFTIETLALAAAALVAVWAAVTRRWGALAGALAFGTAEALHAGRYLDGDGNATVVALRLAGLALIALDALPPASRRWLLGGGLALAAAGSLWGAFGGTELFDWGPHVLLGAAALAIVAWVLAQSASSVRLRIVTAFVTVLAIAIVAGGGAVARVSALDRRNEALATLGDAVTAARDKVVETGAGAERRAASLSPTLATDLRLIERVKLIDESALVVSRDRRVRIPVGRLPLDMWVDVRPTFDAETHTTFAISGGELAAYGAAPVFRPGTARTASNVIAVVVIRRAFSINDLAAIVKSYDRTAGLRVRSERYVLQANLPRQADRLSRTVALPDGGPQLTAITPSARVATAANDLIRALLAALLAAALLAVVIALWLSDRVARPIVDLADEAERVKADFLSTVSHELRTPLTPIRGYTELLRRGRVPRRQATGYLDEIGEAAARLERIVRLLVDVAAMDADRFRVDLDEISMTETVTAAADRWRDRSRRHPIRLDVGRALPRVRADSSAIAHVLDELVDNAIKFSPDGGEVEMRARRTRRGVEVSVRDTGVGLDADKAAALTTAFAQAASGDARRFPGLGLGLTYVAGVLAAHGAALTATAAPGAGTTFRFTVPTVGMVTRMPARAAPKSR